MRGIIQVAGVIDRKEADMLVSEGVRYLGFPFGLTVHREDIGEADAAEIILSLKPPASAVLITYAGKAEDIAGLCQRIGTTRVQLHGDIAVQEIIGLKSFNPGIAIIKSLIVRDKNVEELECALQTYGPHVDMFITDTYDPETGASGATGKTHDWAVSRRLVDVSPRPVILAGGLTPRNVRKAITEVRPAGVDVHTGVEGPDGRKDILLVRAFVREALSAFADIE